MKEDDRTSSTSMVKSEDELIVEKEARQYKTCSPWLIFGVWFTLLTAAVAGVTVAKYRANGALRGNRYVGENSNENGDSGTNEPTLAPSSKTSVENSGNEDFSTGDSRPPSNPASAPSNESAGTNVGSEDCSFEQVLVEYFIELDQDSLKETGWTLQCNREVIWNVPPGFLEETKTFRDGNQILKRTCVDRIDTCVFTIQDTYGDGLVEGPGYYYLKYGATTVAVYENEEFFEHSYCFGPECEKPLLEAEDNDDNDCDMLYLSIGLDAKPEEIDYQVECNNEIVLLGPWGSTKQPFEEIEEETCMTPYSCCRLTVNDSGKDGLTQGSEDGSKQGWIYFEYGTRKTRYDGDQDGDFEKKVIEFGC